MRHSRIAPPTLALLLTLTACGGGGGTTASPPASPQESPTESPAGAEPVDATPVVGSLVNPYAYDAEGSPVPPASPEDLPFQPGTVDAHWYSGGDVWVILFAGLSLDETGPICPGSSLQTDSGFQHVTNSPTEEGACEGITGLAGPGAGARVCGDVLLYITEIPFDSAGTLWASVNRQFPDGTSTGVTGTVPADPSSAPEIDPGAEGYTLPDAFDGAEVTC